MPAHPLVFKGGENTKTNYSTCSFAASGLGTIRRGGHRV